MAVVRRRPLWKRIRAYPLDLLLSLNEQVSLIDWDSYSERVALPMGVVLTVIFFFVRLYQDNQPVVRRSQYFQYDEGVLQGSKYFRSGGGQAWGLWFAGCAQWLIIAVNIINTLMFMMTTRRYVVFNKDVVASSHARKVSNTRSWWPWSSVQGPEGVDSFWEMNIWNPSKFCTYLFISFPPFNLMLLYTSSSSFINLFYLLITSVVLYFVIVKGYLQLIEDKQMIYRETFDEYQRKYVNPQLSVARREVAVDATQGPHGPLNNPGVSYYSPGRQEKLFKVHDMKGREQIEVFEDGEFTPKKIIRNNDLRKSMYLTPGKGYVQSPLSRKTRQS